MTILSEKFPEEEPANAAVYNEDLSHLEDSRDDELTQQSWVGTFEGSNKHNHFCSCNVINVQF